MNENAEKTSTQTDSQTPKRDPYDESPINEEVRIGREAFLYTVSKAEKERDHKTPKETPRKEVEHVGGIKEDEIGIISRIADKVVDYTERMVGRPVYQKDQVEYTQSKESLRAEIKGEEQKR